MVMGNVFKSALADWQSHMHLLKLDHQMSHSFKLDKETKISPNFIATIEAIQIFLYPISSHVKQLFILDNNSRVMLFWFT
jgi:hypothetical protein